MVSINLDPKLKRRAARIKTSHPDVERTFLVKLMLG
jgi:hypothetical protein